MSSEHKDFFNLLKERGFIHQTTSDEKIEELAKQQKLVAYLGFDATADSLHVGSLLQIMMLRHLQKTGNKPIVLMGGATTKIGDPSGKDEARKFLDDAAIEHNKSSIAKIFQKFMSFGDGPSDAMMVDNNDWLADINYIDFLRDYGRHFTINRMLTFDSVKLRLDREQPLTFLEFNYMILQAYDFAELARRHGCNLQMGGSDQWGNIINGVELGRRVDNAELYGLTTPLMTTSSGVKMGKSANGAVWLNEDRLSSYDYWQFWRNTEDADVGRLLKLFTELPLDEIARLEKLEGKEINDAKVILANEATKLCHGADAASAAEATAKKVFEQGSTGDDLPVIELTKAELNDGIPAFKLFVLSGLCDSNGAARRLIQGKGGKLNNKVIEDANQLISVNDIDGDAIKLSFGQKKHVLVKAN